MIRQIPRALASAVVALILIVFIAYPLGSVLVESFSVSGPMSLTDLH